MKELKDLRDLLCHEIQVLHNGEKLILKGLERMISKAHNPELKAMFEKHFNETEMHISRLEQVAGLLDLKPSGDDSAGIKGLIAEAEKTIHKDASPEVLDAALIAGAQKIEHYEIAGYGTALCYAQELGNHPVANILMQTLEEEQATDTLLNNLAKQKINMKAQ